MILKITLTLILVALPVISGFASTLTKEFDRPDGTHKVKIDINEENFGNIKNARITASEYVRDKKIWSLVDYVNKCPLDINMALIKDSFEIKKINGSFDAVLFSYTIGCVGGLDPVTVKYFAYENGVKHSLRGEERMIIPNGVIDDNVKPVPDTNLKNNILLYKYMTSNWHKASTVVLE
ncbi:M949_RS01915 family surface polysaccharide biosynthesis protein [Erwinia sp. STN24]|uniref:M949_RS01915 family surface polysaccharide biosynthesis protein n=1 Tax=Erwinia sp. STN24 TaxID=3233996 RepID=UPI003521239D